MNAPIKHETPEGAIAVYRTPYQVLVEAHKAAVTKLAGITFTDIRGEADLTDARNLVDDLNMLCAIVDPLVEAFGDYAGAHWHGIDRDLFKDQLLGALQGNATFTIEDAAKDAHDSREDIEADLWRGLQRAAP